MRLLMIALILPLTGACQSKWEKDGTSVASSGGGATRSFAAAGFSGVDLRGSDDVDVKTGANFAVSAEGDPKVLDQLRIEVVEGVLRVGRKDNDGKWFDNDKGAKVHVVMPRLTTASVHGSGNLNVERAEGDVSAVVAGSGNLVIADLRGGAADLSVAGSGDLDVSGTATRLTASIAGSGDLDAQGLTASSAEVSIAGSGDITGVVKGAAAVSIVGSGNVELTGGAKCTVSAVGSGEAHCS
jgi:putative autotransporter adhesin-like protein